MATSSLWTLPVEYFLLLLKNMLTINFTAYFSFCSIWFSHEKPTTWHYPINTAKPASCALTLLWCFITKQNDILWYLPSSLNKDAELILSIQPRCYLSNNDIDGNGNFSSNKWYACREVCCSKRAYLIKPVKNGGLPVGL